MPKVKKIPRRQCVGCREMKDKPGLLRVVKSPEGNISLDFKGKNPGRGAYLCRNAACFRRARKSRSLERVLKTAIPPEIFDALEREIEAETGQDTESGQDKNAGQNMKIRRAVNTGQNTGTGGSDGTK